MTCSERPAPQPSQTCGREAGASLIEMMMATALLGIVIAGITLGYTNFQRAINRRDSVTEANSQITMLMDRIQKYWHRRARPAAAGGVMFPGYSAAWPGFKTLGSASALIYLASDQSQTARISTSCVALPSTAAYAKASFVQASSCRPCGRGSRQQVLIRASNAPLATYPAGRLASQTSVLSLSVCIQPWKWPEALSLDVQAGTMDPSGQIVVISKTLDLPIDNFSGLNINQ